MEKLFFNKSVKDCVEITEIMKFFGDLTILRSVRFTFVLLYSAIFVLGLIGNYGVLHIIVSKPINRTPSNFLIGNLAITNFLLSISNIPISPVIFFFKKWNFGHLLCKLLPAIQSTTVSVASFSLCAITIDR